MALGVDPADGDTMQHAPRASGEKILTRRRWTAVGLSAGVMALGTLLAVFPGRRRNPLDAVSAPVAVEPPKDPTGVTV